MQGDLNLPPILVRKSRAKSAFLAAVLAAFAVGCFLVWRDNPAKPGVVLILPGVALFGLGFPVVAWQAIRPDQLSLSPAGLVYRSIRKTLTYTWDQLSEFSVYSIRGTKMIGFDVIGTGTPSKLAGVNTALTDMNAALPGLWEIEPEQLAELLNSARAKWGPPAELEASKAAR
jgi:hypothetical protein